MLLSLKAIVPVTRTTMIWWDPPVLVPYQVPLHFGSSYLFSKLLGCSGEVLSGPILDGLWDLGIMWVLSFFSCGHLEDLGSAPLTTTAMFFRLLTLKGHVKFREPTKHMAWVVEGTL